MEMKNKYKKPESLRLSGPSVSSQRVRTAGSISCLTIP